MVKMTSYTHAHTLKRDVITHQKKMHFICNNYFAFFTVALPNKIASHIITNSLRYLTLMVCVDNIFG